MLKQEKRGKNLAILRPKNCQNCNFELLNAAFMYSAVFHKQAYSQKHFAHFQACLLTRAPTVTKAIVLIMIIWELPKISIGSLFIHT